MLRAKFHRFAPVNIVPGIFILMDIIIEGLVVLFFAKQDLVTVYVHQIGVALVSKSEGVSLIFDPYFMPFFGRTVVYIDRDRQPEDLTRFLGLIDDHLHLATGIIIYIIDR